MAAQLSTLRSELRARLGLAASADTFGPSVAILNSILQRAQNWLYWAYGWENLRRTWTFATVIGQASYNWPTNGGGEVCEPRRNLDLWLINAGSPTELREGVPLGLRGTTPNGPPTRYWRTNQINLWPAPDSTAYTVDIEGYKALGAFAADADTVTLDDEPVMDLAIALGKYHYGQADAQTYLGLVNALLGRLNERDDLTGQAKPLTDPDQEGAP